MAATREQGNALAVLLAGFTALPAGLVARAEYPVIGTLAAIVGAILTVGSLVQSYRLKPIELAEDKGGK